MSFTTEPVKILKRRNYCRVVLHDMSDPLNIFNVSRLIKNPYTVDMGDGVHCHPVAAREFLSEVGFIIAGRHPRQLEQYEIDRIVSHCTYLKKYPPKDPQADKMVEMADRFIKHFAPTVRLTAPYEPVWAAQIRFSVASLGRRSLRVLYRTP